MQRSQRDVNTGPYTSVVAKTSVDTCWSNRLPYMVYVKPGILYTNNSYTVEAHYNAMFGIHGITPI